MKNFNYYNLPPFKWFMLENFPFIEYDFDALTNWQLFCKIGKEINKIRESQNLTGQQVEQLTAAFNSLQDYINNYFENLDVQDEINNKLDEMAANGTLSTLLNIIPNQDIKFRRTNTFQLEGGENGEYLNYLQGMCRINESTLVMALRSNSNNDNYIRLIELNLYNNQILRSATLELNHANAIGYDSTNDLLYIASCNKYENGSLVSDNSIKVVKYSTFTLLDTINISNIPTGHRIRSVYYDNINNKLYAADVFDVYEIDIENETITNTISLENYQFDNTVTNQTIKKYKNYFIGLYLTFIAIWDLNGKLVKIINLDYMPQLQKIGEYEDFDFNVETGKIILAGISTMTSRRFDRTISIFESYLFNSTNDVLTRLISGSADTTDLNIYVDNTATNKLETGTSDMPFHDLQNAINMAKNYNKGSVIHVSGSSYPKIYINSVNGFALDIEADVTIDEIEINKSQVIIYNSSNYNLTCNKFLSTYSKVDIRKLNSGKHIFKNIAIQASNFTIENTDIYAIDNNCINFSKGSTGFIYNCTFSDYAGHYAISLIENSIVSIYNLTFNETVTSSQHTFLITTGATLLSRLSIRDKNNFVIQTQGRVFPSEEILPAEDIQNKYFGDICTVDTHFNKIRLKVRVAGVNSYHKWFTIDLANTNNTLADTNWINDQGIRIGALVVAYADGKISIIQNRNTFIKNSDGTITYNAKTDNDTDVNFCSVESVRYIIE